MLNANERKLLKMRISIENQSQIEDLVDQIIDLQDVTTSTSEVKSQIINLIQDNLYHKIKNISLSTIIKEQFNDDDHKNSNIKVIKTTEKKQPVSKANEKSNDQVPSSTTQEQVSKETNRNTSDQPQGIFASQITSKEKENTAKIQDQDPLSQYKANPQLTAIKYADIEFDFSIKPLKKGIAIGQKALILQKKIDPQITQIFEQDKIKQNLLNKTMSQLSEQNFGQVVPFYSLSNNVIFVLANENTLNDFTNRLYSLYKELIRIAKLTDSEAEKELN